MKKIIQLLGLSLGLLSCTEDLDFNHVQNGDTENPVSRAVGDGAYEALGYGYDITEEYLGENSVKLTILDIEKFKRENAGRFYNPFVGVMDQKICAGEDATSFLHEIMSSGNFKGSIAAMGVKDTAKGFFSGTVTNGFESKTKYSYSSKYSFARAELLKKQRRYYLNTDIGTLSKYLSATFLEDLKKYSADDIIQMYGTHVLTDITVGGRYTAYYKSVIIKEDNRTEKKKTVEAGLKLNFSKVGLDTSGTWNRTEIVETSKKNSTWNCTIRALGGSTSGTTMTLTPEQGPTISINLGSWKESVDDTHSKLIDVDWNKTYPVYDLVSDPVKKAELKAAVNRYIDSKKITTLKLTPLYALYWPKGVNSHFVTSWTEVVKYLSEGHQYFGVTGYINKESVSGAKAVYKLYWNYGRNTTYTTSWNDVLTYTKKDHEYQGIIGYINDPQALNTIPLYSMYYPAGRDSHHSTVWADVQAWVKNRGDEYDGILGYIYPYTEE